MEIRPPRRPPWSFVLKFMIPPTLGLLLLVACSMGFLTKPKAKSTSTAKSAATTEAKTAEFTFPQAKCGEESATPSASWYPVFINGADLNAIRSQYCGNAISQARKGTGTPAVKLASFTSYEKAKKFAAAVGGEVEVSSTTDKPGSTETAQTSSTRQDAMSGKTALLSSAEAGSPINIRQSASTDASVQEVAYSGDSIQVSSKTQGNDGYTWYKVVLASGASGWVRSDLIKTEDAASTPAFSQRSTTASTPPSIGAFSTASTDPSSAASSSPSTTATSPSSTTASTSPSTASSTASSTTIASASTSSSRSSGSASGRAAMISSSEPDSPINVRSGAGTDAEVQDIAYSGDRVQITDTQQGNDGQTWYHVQFDSGASGWVRSDFIGH